MTNQHTPGPWKHVGLTMIQGAGDPHRNIPGIVANVTPAGTLHDATVCAANARLIAAAPDLLAACKAALPEIEQEREQREYSGNDEYIEGMRSIENLIAAAIAKAEGAA